MSQQSGPIYGYDETFLLQEFAIDHHGYFYGCQTGTYIARFVLYSGALYFWVNNTATSGWTAENAVTTMFFTSDDNIFTTAEYEFTMNAGSYLPMRLFFAQPVGYGGMFLFNITTPDGQTAYDYDLATNPYMVTEECSWSSLPPFPPWGNEI
jgi:hypothetical protein